VTLFPAVVTLWDTRVHVSASDSDNVSAEVEEVIETSNFALEPF